MKHLHLLMAFLAALFISGCGGGGDAPTSASSVTYTGTFTGTYSGTWTMAVSASGVVTGTATDTASNQYNLAGAISGGTTYSGGTSECVWNGTLSAGTLSGSWYCVSGASGTFTSASAGSTSSIAGSWTVTTVSSNNTCGEPADAPYTITISQNGSSITAVTPAGTFSGSISGNTLTWSGSYADQGGTTTINSLQATVSGNSFSGTSSWTWADGFTSCSGTDTFTGSR